ncbi:Vegetative incompatibility protein HET-E-1 [Cytospora mali]|uniref:Vegetative incompatibility protein HET-E-1 n=1 Tax=Cytospora mali TaxID=578113 RepID=A0A194V601_CYTMA|nr:Vegetative incompatibility protein HET-E-1 [Valsa mali var. pyri (nom. inval.)]
MYMLLDQQPRLMPHIRNKYDHAGDQLFNDVNAWEALSKILDCMVKDPCFQNTYVVIDALDECKAGDLPKLLDFIVDKSAEYSNIKWIVSSRNWPDIDKDSNKATSAAVTSYIKLKVERLAINNQYSPETKTMVQQHLLTNAHDTFLWVALVCQAVARMPDWEVDMQAVSAFPPGLYNLYERMINRINDLQVAELCRRVLAAITVVYQPITLDELPSLVELPSKYSGNDEALEYIIGLCGSFMTPRDRTVLLVHQSAKDFLLYKATQKVFPTGISKTHHDIISTSIKAMSRTLKRDIYDLQHPDIPIDDVQPPKPNPLAPVKYCCLYWIDHLLESDFVVELDTETNDGSVVDRFLKQSYLYWLEASSLLRNVFEGKESMRKLEEMLEDKATVSQLHSLVLDMLYCLWHNLLTIKGYPLQVYASLLVFCPAVSLTRLLFQREDKPELKLIPAIKNNWSTRYEGYEVHSQSIKPVNLSPDSTWLVSGSDDRTIKVWDSETGRCLQTLEVSRDTFLRYKSFDDTGTWFQTEYSAFDPDLRSATESILEITTEKLRRKGYGVSWDRRYTKATHQRDRLWQFLRSL